MTYDYPLADIPGFKFGYFKLTGGFLSDKMLIYDLLFRLSLLFVFAISVSSILYPLTKKIPEQLFINPINRFIDLISNNSVPNELTLKSLPVELEVLEGKILALLKTATEHERNKATVDLGHLSARLAHEIHSPLAAMEMGLGLLTKRIPKNELTILINGIQSVRDIANNVLKRYRNDDPVIVTQSYEIAYDDGNLTRPVLLSSLVELIISQKRYEWYHQPCELIFTVKHGAKIGWIQVAPNEVKRLFSNLLNNAYDSFNEKHKGVIHVTLCAIENELHVQLHDNGTGIPIDKLSDVLNGVSLKHGGKGLGLSGAKQYIEHLGGRLGIVSDAGLGTQITLIFPRINNISWFPQQIRLSKATIVVVLDDDISTLTYWEARISEAGLQPKLFSTYEKASRWLESNNSFVASTVFIADYELAESSNGLMFLEKINSHNNRYLVTSHAEEIYYQNAAQQAGVWLIPRSVVGDIEFNFEID